VADLNADPSTPAVISPGQSLVDAIETPRDRDWVRLDLDEGQIVRITVEGRGADPLEDSRLWVRGPEGRILEFNDDSGDGYASSLIFVAPSTGPFFLDVGGYDRTVTGRYRLSVEETQMPVNVLPALDWGTQQDDRDVSFWFAPAGRRVDGYVSEGFNDYEKARFAAAFSLIEEVTGLTFREVGNARSADFRLALDLDETDGEFLGYFNPPGEDGGGAGVFDGAQWDRTAGGSLQAGGYDFVTIVHEILHGLGLAHPHDNGGGSEIFPGVSNEFGDYGYAGLNEGVYTTMSYNTGHPADTDSQGHRGERWGYEYGPMALDIALLQQKYGTNMDHATGDDTYLLPTANRQGTFWAAIWDAGGIDTMRHDSQADAVIDLRPATLRYEAGGGGFLSEVAGVAGGFTIAAGVVIENAVGGAGNDVITGNDADNALSGGTGHDILTGGVGNDNLSGDRGRDSLNGGTGDDNLSGGTGADRFVFAVLPDNGGFGDDYIADFGRGRDRIDLGELGSFSFIGTADFGGTGQAEVGFRAEVSELVVVADINGDGSADLVFRLAGASALVAGDFLLG